MSEFMYANSTLVLVLGFGLLALVVALTPVVVFILQWRLVRHAEIEAGLQKAELEAGLKRDMVSRGMSAGDIRQVLETSASFGESGAPGGPDGAAGKWAAFARRLARFGRKSAARGGCGS